MDSPRPNSIPWRKLCEAGKLGEVLHTIRTTRSLKFPILLDIFYSLLQWCTQKKDLEAGRLVYIHIVEGTLDSNSYLGSHLIRMFSSCRRLDEAQHVFNRLPNPNVFAWNEIILAHIDLGQSEHAISLYKYMQCSTAVQPDAHILVTILKACAKAEDLKHGKYIHGHIIDKGLFENDLYVWSTIMDMYSKCGSLKDARRVFDRLKKHNVVTWSVMISCYVEHRSGAEAVKLYKKMQLHGFTSDTVMLVSILKACASIGALEEGKLLHAQISENHIVLDALLGNSLLDMYIKCGSIADACNLFASLQKHDVVTWTEMIEAYAEHKDHALMLSYIESMICQGLRLDKAAFICLLSACSQLGLVKNGCSHFNAMAQKHGLPPRLDHFNCIVDLLGRAGYLLEAEDLLCTMPFEANIVGWRSLLGHCRSHGDVELGNRCYESVANLDHKDASCYVIMSNIYLHANREMDALNVEGSRKCAKACKMPGEARLMLHNEMHHIVVADESYGCNSKAYEKLMRLTSRTQKEDDQKRGATACQRSVSARSLRTNDVFKPRKWQDARLEREQEEKRKAEEVLNRRRRERARLSSYIYSSPQNADKRYFNGSQGNKKCMDDGNKLKTMRGGDPRDISEKRSISKGNDVCFLSSVPITKKPCGLQTWSQGSNKCVDDGDKLLRRLTGGDSMDISERICVSKSNDVCCQSSAPVTNKPCDMQTWHTDTRQDESEGTPDLLEVALQERVENEEATSVLIAEITDMKSRLDDCLSKPLLDDLSVDILVRAGLESCTDSDHGTKISEQTYEHEDFQLFQSNVYRNDQINTFMFTREEDLKGLESCTDSDRGTEMSGQKYEHEEFQWCKSNQNRKDQINALMLQKEEGLKGHDGVNYGTTYMNIDDLGSNLSTWKGQYGNMEGKQIGQGSDITMDGINTSTSNRAIMKSDQSSTHGHEVSHDKENREHNVLHNMLQEPHKQQHSNNISTQSKTKQNAQAITPDYGVESKSTKQKIRPKSLLSCWSKSSNILSSLNLAPACQGSYAKLDTLSGKHSRKQIPSCLGNKKLGSKDIGFSNHEASILASIERLDAKLAFVSAKMSNSSRTSFISDELQSIRSAPPLMKHKPASNTTVGSLASKRRQNVGLTNMSKEKTSEFHSCIPQKPRKLLDLPVKDQNERRQTSDGTIILHQNAEFLFR